MITIAPVTRDKEIVKVTWLWGNDTSTSWSGVPNGTLWMRFTCCPNLMFLVSSWLERNKEFQTNHFADFEHFKIDSHFTLFGQVKIDPNSFTFTILGRSHLFYRVWARHLVTKTIETLLIWQRIQEPHIRSGLSHFQLFNSGNQELGSPANKSTSKF